MAVDVDAHIVERRWCVGDHPFTTGSVRDQLTGGIVDVDHRQRRKRRIEQPRLRPAVVLLGAMEVEVVAAEVGEDDGVERSAVDPVQRECV